MSEPNELTAARAPTVRPDSRRSLAVPTPPLTPPAKAPVPAPTLPKCPPIPVPAASQALRPHSGPIGRYEFRSLCPDRTKLRPVRWAPHGPRPEENRGTFRPASAPPRRRRSGHTRNHRSKQPPEPVPPDSEVPAGRSPGFPGPNPVRPPLPTAPSGQSTTVTPQAAARSP